MENKKIMTANTTSIGVDAMQSYKEDYEYIIAEGVEKINTDCNKFQTISMAELFDTAFKPRKPLIEGLLYNGVYLFVGAPKVGKSFAMEQIGYHISCGEPIWGREVTQGTVLYLALEDDYARLQSRLYRMFDINSTPNYHFSIKSEMISNGLENQLKEFIEKYNDTSLIIIDTLQKVRELSGDSFNYAKDYEVITSLKNFADENNICIVLVHHTRKQEGSDAFDSISGTNGLFGAADGAFVLHKDKRTNADAVLDVSGRDIQDQRLFLKRNDNCSWDLIKEELEIIEDAPDEIIEAVASIINSENPFWIGTATELSEQISCEIKANQLTKKLNCNNSFLRNNYNVYYNRTRKKDATYIELKLIE